MTRLSIHHMSAVSRSHAEIAEAINAKQPDEPVSVRSVRRILKEPVPTIAALASQHGLGAGRPCVAEAFRNQVTSTLESEPTLSTAELLRRARSQWNYSGEKTAFYRLVKLIRRPEGEGAEPIVRFEGVAGEYAQFDFGERWVIYPNKIRRKVIAFVGRLKYSRHVHVQIVPDQRAETLVRAVVSCLQAWDCVPLIWVFDNPKTVRTSRNGEPIVLHPYLAGLAAELNAGVLLCTPHQPQQKGSVERGVKWFKNSFLAQRQFIDDADLLAQTASWLEEVNTRRVSDATGEIPMNRLERERILLAGRRLPFTSADYALRQPVTVLPTGMVHVFGTSYSVNPKKVGAPAVAFMRADTVEIVIDGVRCTHRRVDFTDDPQRLPEHNQAMLAVVHGERKQNTFKRQCLWELGDGARNFLERLIHKLGAHGNWSIPVHRLFALLEEHGAGAMAAALGRCHEQCRYDVSDVVQALRPQAVAP